MSGHSKWATIKRQKGANDAKRGQLFTKLSNSITLAVKQGGGSPDPSQNFKLRLSVEAARNANMPKENIERAIKRAEGKQGADLAEVMYEGFGPGGITVIVEAATDNKLRTTSVVKNVFDKNGGNMGQPGSVSYQFKQVGQIGIGKDGKSLDDVFLVAAEAGAEDVEDVEDQFLVTTSVANLAEVRDKLNAAGFAITSAELSWVPTLAMELSGDEAEKAINFLEKLEDIEDVQKVYSNLEVATA